MIYNDLVGLLYARNSSHGSLTIALQSSTDSLSCPRLHTDNRWLALDSKMCVGLHWNSGFWSTFAVRVHLCLGQSTGYRVYRPITFVYSENHPSSNRGSHGIWIFENEITGKLEWEYENVWQPRDLMKEWQVVPHGGQKVQKKSIKFSRGCNCCYLRETSKGWRRLRCP